MVEQSNFQMLFVPVKGDPKQGCKLVWESKKKCANISVYILHIYGCSLSYHQTIQDNDQNTIFPKLFRLRKRHLSFPQNCKDHMNLWQSHMCSNRPGSSVNCFRQGPCLPCQMEAEVQGVKVEEDILCQTSDGALSDFGKHSIPQFIEPSCCSSGYAVWNHQSVKHTKSVPLGFRATRWLLIQPLDVVACLLLVPCIEIFLKTTRKMVHII